MILSRKFVVGTFVVLPFAILVASIAACGSDTSSHFKDPDAGGGIFGDGSLQTDGNNGQNPGVVDDPPPAYCGAGSDAGTQIPNIGGTADCPDDKNLPGCGCDNPGATAPCWTGYRKNRNLGGCKDGTATCINISENRNEWGPCNGEVLPKTQGSGADACTCFSVGTWTIKNTAPCIWDDSQYYAYSTIQDDSTGNLTNCTVANHLPLGQTPASIWSHDTLKTDCAGSFDLIFRIKVGDYNNPKDSDCILGQSKVHADYTTENVEQTLPDLPPWSSTDDACAKAWETGVPDTVSPGYGEMVVEGETEACTDGKSPDGKTKVSFVFNRVQYCPKICRDAAHQQDDVCVKCTLSGTGHF
jgi:hypothetical protein